MSSLRQGDVLLVAIDRIPAHLTSVLPVEHRGRRCFVVAQGERTGHAHVLPAKVGVALLRGENAAAEVIDVLDVPAAGAELLHEQHRALPVPAGRYRIIMQRQYDPTLDGGLAVAD